MKFLVPQPGFETGDNQIFSLALSQSELLGQEYKCCHW